jgi:hypothetical protein
MDPGRPIIDPTADNHRAVQAAVDETAAAGGGVVRLPSGRCPIGSPIELRDNVTLQGSGMLTTTIGATGSAGTLVVAGRRLTGATVEDLTIDGGADGLDEPDPAATASASPAPRGAAGIDLGAGASFCFLRRLRLVDLAGGAVRVAGGPIDHLYLEQLVIERCGGDGVDLAPSGDTEAVFLTEVSVRSFGLGGSGAAGVRLAGRAFISQLHVQPIGPGATGLALEAGSDDTVASNLFFGLSGGDARSSGAGTPSATIEAELLRDLLDHRLARAYP